MSVFPTRILLATDGSEATEQATEAAVDLSNKSGSELHVLHVWHDVPGPYAHKFVRGELRRQGQEILDEQVQKIEETGATVAKAHLRGGRTSDEIVGLSDELEGILGSRPEVRLSGGSPAPVLLEETQRESPPALIAVGSRGLAGLTRTSLGSVSTKVVTTTPGPVLVCPHLDRD